MRLKQSSLGALLLVFGGCGQSDLSTVIDSVQGDGGSAEGSVSEGGSSASASAGEGNGGGNGTTNGQSGGGNTDDNCQEYRVQSRRVTPDLLIVLDRSGSMKDGNRWEPSVAAIKGVTGQLDSQINFGLMVFPTDNTCGAGTIRVPVGPMAAASIATELDKTTPNGSTPTAASLAAAHQTLGVPVGPDEVGRPKLVLLVTDGSPNCCGASFECLVSANEVALDASVAEIVSMANDGIKTYVIGYDTKGTASLASAMDRMAVAGATGDMQHRAVEDSASLVTALEEITGKVASCSFVLDEAPRDPSYVLVTLDGKKVTYDAANGWSMDPADGKKIELKGKACETLQNGADEHVLRVEVKCEIVQVI